MFRGFTSLSVDSKGRVAVPSRYRQHLHELSNGELVLTINPLERSLWMYPLSEWEIIESKLAKLSEFDTQSRRAKRMMHGFADDRCLDSQGRILMSQELREHAGIEKQVVLLGQGNKFEIWDEAAWKQQRDEWLAELETEGSEPSEQLKSLSL